MSTRLRTMQDLLDGPDGLGYSKRAANQIRAQIKRCATVYRTPLARIRPIVPASKTVRRSPGRRPLRDLAERRSRCLANDQRHRRRGEHPHQVRRHFGLYPLQGRDDRGSALHRLDQHLGLQREGETRRHPRFGQPFRKPSAKLVNAIPAPDKTASDRPGLTQLDDEWGRRDRAVMRGRCATTCAAPCAASGPGCAAPCAASGPGSWGGLLQGPAHPRFIGFLRTWLGREDSQISSCNHYILQYHLRK
jgi:hypothetical protein